MNPAGAMAHIQRAVIVLCAAGILLQACSRPALVQLGEEPVPREWIDGMSFSTLREAQPFAAEVVGIDIKKLRGPGPGEGRICYYVTLVKTNGTKTGFGELDPKPPQLDFVQSLQVGHVYSFPIAILEWEKTRASDSR